MAADFAIPPTESPAELRECIIAKKFLKFEFAIWSSGLRGLADGRDWPRESSRELGLRSLFRGSPVEFRPPRRVTGELGELRECIIAKKFLKFEFAIWSSGLRAVAAGPRRLRESSRELGLRSLFRGSKLGFGVPPLADGRVGRVAGVYYSGGNF